MNINIEKIENGYVVTVGSQKTFCSTGESICGLLAEWALKTVEALDKRPTTYGDAAAEIMKAQLMMPPPGSWLGKQFAKITGGQED